MKKDAESKLLPVIVGPLLTDRKQYHSGANPHNRNMGHRSISDELSIEDSTSTNYLAAKAEMDDAPASIGRRKGAVGGAITSHY